jgi:hypothetical protein
LKRALCRRIVFLPLSKTFAADINPISLWVDSLRHLFVGTPIDNQLWVGLIWAIGIVVIFAPLAVWRYRRRRLRRRGRRLAPRWRFSRCARRHGIVHGTQPPRQQRDILTQLGQLGQCPIGSRQRHADEDNQANEKQPFHAEGYLASAIALGQEVANFFE